MSKFHVIPTSRVAQLTKHLNLGFTISINSLKKMGYEPVFEINAGCYWDENLPELIANQLKEKTEKIKKYDISHKDLVELAKLIGDHNHRIESKIDLLSAKVDKLINLWEK